MTVADKHLLLNSHVGDLVHRRGPCRAPSFLRAPPPGPAAGDLTQVYEIRPDRSFAQAIGGEGALALGLRESTLLQHAEMVRYEGLRQPGRVHDVRDVLAVLREDPNDPQAVGVTEGAEQVGNWFN